VAAEAGNKLQPGPSLARGPPPGPSIIAANAGKPVVARRQSAPRVAWECFKQRIDICFILGSDTDRVVIIFDAESMLVAIFE
jgi:hypothetical protein